MVKIVFGAVGAEGLRNVSIDEEVGCLENDMLDQGTVTQMADSHRTLPMSEDNCLESCFVERREDVTTTFDTDHINTLDVVSSLNTSTMKREM
jgi:hypothetical protein